MPQLTSTKVDYVSTKIIDSNASIEGHRMSFTFRTFQKKSNKEPYAPNGIR